jgi:putative ABC transport system permease protein
LRWFVRLFTAEGWALLAVATVGTFAMMWLWVSSLLGEVGVRRAVGARRLRILVYVLARALLVAAGGVAFGSWVGMMVWDAVSGIVSGLPSWEPGAVGRLGLLLAAAAVLGAWLPAHKATHTVPARLLSS